MKKTYDFIIWDLDGTLLDTSEGVLSASQYAIDYFNFSRPSTEIMKTFIGPPIQCSFAKTFNLTEETAQEMAAVFRKQYKEKELFKAEPYPGIRELIQCLHRRGIKQAVATYKREDYTETIIDYFGFSPWLDVICGSDFAGKLTKTDIIVNAIKKISDQYSLDRGVMVGDTENDIIGAENIGIDFIAVSYGFGFKCHEELKYNAVVGIASDVVELGNLLGCKNEN